MCHTFSTSIVSFIPLNATVALRDTGAQLWLSIMLKPCHPCSVSALEVVGGIFLAFLNLCMIGGHLLV